MKSQRILCLGLAAALLAAEFAPAQAVAPAGPWSDPAEVWRGATRCLSYRGRLLDDYLIVEVSHETGWHTYAMDNKERAADRLAGLPSLGIEQPTEITIGEGLEAIGAWHQSNPKDLSQPELRWYTWGFEKTSLFAVKVKRTGGDYSEISIRGQACDSKTCQDIRVALRVPLSATENGDATQRFDVRKLVKVQLKPDQSGTQ